MKVIKSLCISYVYLYESYICQYIDTDITNALLYVGCCVLKKYYNFLWQNFPQDHLTTLSRFCKMVQLSDGMINNIASSPTSDEGNQKILNICIVAVDKDTILLEFSDLINRIIDNPKLSTMMKIFKNG